MQLLLIAWISSEREENETGEYLNIKWALSMSPRRSTGWQPTKLRPHVTPLKWRPSLMRIPVVRIYWRWKNVALHPPPPSISPLISPQVPTPLACLCLSWLESCQTPQSPTLRPCLLFSFYFLLHWVFFAVSKLLLVVVCGFPILLLQGLDCKWGSVDAAPRL